VAKAIAEGMDKVAKETKRVQETAEKGLTGTREAIQNQTEINREIGRNTKEVLRESVSEIKTNFSENEQVPNSDLESSIDKLKSSMDTNTRQQKNVEIRKRPEDVNNENRLDDINQNPRQ
ncbi:MAG: hypothetical protein KW788_03315, partial [Candidatus Doudnabacteria bacterium]|nr:hypothetical protein [Candidatus Doudnabacteria bacterium]